MEAAIGDTWRMIWLRSMYGTAEEGGLVQSFLSAMRPVGESRGGLHSSLGAGCSHRWTLSICTLNSCLRQLCTFKPRPSDTLPMTLRPLDCALMTLLIVHVIAYKLRLLPLANAQTKFKSFVSKLMCVQCRCIWPGIGQFVLFCTGLTKILIPLSLFE